MLLFSLLFFTSPTRYAKTDTGGVVVCCVFHVATVPAPPPCRLVRLSSLLRPRSVTGTVLCALDALEAAEVPAFLQARAHAGHFLSEGAGQPREKSLHLTGVDLQKPKKKGNLEEFWKLYQATEHFLISIVLPQSNSWTEPKCYPQF